MAYIKSEPVDDSTEDWDGYEEDLQDDFDEAESGNELEEPTFVTVKEEPDDGNLLDEDMFESSDNAQVSDIVEGGELTTSNEASFEAFDDRGKEEDPIANTNGLPRDALESPNSECLNYCHQCNSIETQNVNIKEHLITNRTKCHCKKAFKKRNDAEDNISLSIASTSKVEKIIYETVNEEGKIEQSGEIQRAVMENEKSADEKSWWSLGENSAAGSNQHTLQSLSDKKNFKCTQCEKTFTTKSSLGSHVLTHTGEKPFQCNQCGRAFNQKSNLNTHMRKHTGEKTFECTQCGRAFNRKGNLSTHMRQHTAEKPFKCSWCGRAFIRKDNLTLHMRQHTGDKPFKCNKCGCEFNQKICLTTHMRQHTGEVPFHCDQCGKGFYWNHSLTRHMQTHSKE